MKDSSKIRLRAKVDVLTTNHLDKHGDVGVIIAKRTIETTIGTDVTYDILFKNGKVVQGYKKGDLTYHKSSEKEVVSEQETP